MSIILHPAINLSPTSILSYGIPKRPIICFSLPRPKLDPCHLRNLKASNFIGKDSILGHGVFVGECGELKRDSSCSSSSRRRRRRRRVVIARFNQGFGFNGGGGGGGKDNGINSRVVGNLILAIGLTYLSMTGQLGWVLDAIVSIWLLVVLIPVVGLGAFLWWAGRDIVQSSCPNCGNDFQVFKSTLNDELQLCPFCSQPFSVVDNKFVRESVKFSNEFTSKKESVNDFIPRPKKGKASSRAVVDVDAEVTDAD